MSNIIELNNIREKHIKEVEAKAEGVEPTFEGLHQWKKANWRF